MSSPESSEEDLGLGEAQAMVEAWIRTHGVRYFSELTNLAILMEEVGELARLFARTHGDQSFKKSDLGREVGDELADILFVLLCLANQSGVNLPQALRANLIKKTERDAKRHRQNLKLQ